MPSSVQRPVEPRAAAEERGAVGREQAGGAVERHLHDALVLAVEELLERLQARERHERLALALGEQVELRRDVAERVPLDRAAGEDRAEDERQREREQRDERDRGEQPRPQRLQPHGRTAL